MIYFVCTNKDGNTKIVDKYDDEQKALKRLKYHYKKEKCRLEVIPVRDIEVGCSLYNMDGSYYRTISQETDKLWLVSNDNNPTSIPDPYSKDRIERWIIGKKLVVAGDKSEAESMVDMMVRLKEKVEENMENICAEQVKLI